MVTGTVKKFLDNKGFGFIVPDEGDDEVFFHQSEIIMEGFRTLDEGQRVEFEVENGPKGLSAKQVKPI
ncbi:MAG: cold shock domain-containing protein [SAR324 cluster bacterium]|nr:cold shock domain-containing protein [SAR324 cluster bacterium]MCZ6558365.1 cold shock domain-containing protein [SAR324 cluster bacterium]MCZ6627465.1 cold shock domain-containing protein [SAR324 cluster bacterium]MCZ6646710.1 cold shock domain-containing protein [SAR324 cluster bacterium]MCZ6843839.1 cold shock domain-containing protein [SAR324 cluster bacterium]